MTSLFARNERLLWRTRFSTTEMPSQFLTQYHTMKSWQFSLFSLKLSLQSTHVHVVHWNGGRAVCRLQTARGFQIAWNIDMRLCTVLCPTAYWSIGGPEQSVHAISGIWWNITVSSSAPTKCFGCKTHSNLARPVWSNPPCAMGHSWRPALETRELIYNTAVFVLDQLWWWSFGMLLKLYFV